MPDLIYRSKRFLKIAVVAAALHISLFCGSLIRYNELLNQSQKSCMLEITHGKGKI